MAALVTLAPLACSPAPAGNSDGDDDATTPGGSEDDTADDADDSTSAGDDTAIADDDTMSGDPGPYMDWVPRVEWQSGMVDYHTTPSGTLATEPVASHVYPSGGDSCFPFWLVGDTASSGDGIVVYYMIELRFPTPFAAGAASDLSILAEDEVWDHAVRPLTWWDEANGHVYVWRSGWATVEVYADTRMTVRFTAGEVCELDSAWPQGAYWEYNCAQDEVLLTLDTWREPDGIDYLSIPDWLDLQVAKHPVSCQTDEVESLGWCLCTLDSYPRPFPTGGKGSATVRVAVEDEKWRASLPTGVSGRAQDCLHRPAADA